MNKTLKTQIVIEVECRRMPPALIRTNTRTHRPTDKPKHNAIGSTGGGIKHVRYQSRNLRSKTGQAKPRDEEMRL